MRLQAGLAEIPAVSVIGRPDATLVAWGAAKPTHEGGVDVFAIADRLEARGWSVDRQQNPVSIHCTVTSNHAPIIGEYLADVRAAVAEVQAHPEASASGNAAMYGMMAKLPIRAFVKKSVLDVMETLYGTETEPPDPTKLGDSDTSPAMRFVNRYASQVDAALNVVETLRSKVLGRRPGSRS